MRIFHIGLLICILGYSPFAHSWSIEAGFEYGAIGKNAGGRSAFSRAFSGSIFSDEVAHSGRQSARIKIRAGDTGWGNWGGIVNFPKALREGDEIWFRMYVFFPEGFDFKVTQGVALKTMRIHTSSPRSVNEGFLDVLLRDGQWVVVGSELGTGWHENNPDWRSLGGPVRRGYWQSLEQYIKFSSIPGLGITRVWQDGKLVKEDTETATLKTDTSVADFIYIFTYWNGGSPQTQHAFVDDIMITSDRPSSLDANGNYFIGVKHVESAIYKGSTRHSSSK